MYFPLIVFKIALFAMLFVIAYLFVFRLRSRLMNRILVAVVLMIIMAFLAAPEISTSIAHRLGIGRGRGPFVLSLPPGNGPPGGAALRSYSGIVGPGHAARSVHRPP